MRKLLALLALVLLLPTLAQAEVGIYSARRGGVGSSAQIIGLWTGTCNGASFMRGDGACAAPAGAGDTLTNTAVSVVNEVAQFADTTGKLLKRSTITGVGVYSAGVMSAYAGVTCTNQFLRVLSVSAAGTCASVSLTADITGILTSANGGTGNGFAKLSGPTTAEKTFTLPDASATILTSNALVTSAQGGTANGFTKFSGPAGAEKTFTLPNASATVLTDNAVVTTAQGGTGLGAQSDDTVLISNGSIWQAKAIPDCTDTGGNHINYTAATNTISCGTSGGGAGAGDVTAAIAFGTDNRMIRSDGVAKGVQSTGITIDDSNNVSGEASITLATGGGVRTSTSAGNTVLLQAYDVDGVSYTTFGTLTAGNTPTFDLAAGTTIGGAPVAQFTDPNLDAILYWRDSDGTIQPVTIGTGITFSSGTLSSSALTSASIDTSAELKAILTDETGSGGAVVFATAPTIDSPVITTKLNMPSVTAFPGSPSTGDVVVVTDDSTAGACDSAAGTATSICRWSGAAWVKLGDGTAAGGALTTTDIDTSAELRAILTDESGTGALIFAGGNIAAGTATTAAANDNTTLIATTAYVQTELTAYASDTVAFTNKTFDASATGNVFKAKGYVYLNYPHLCDGTGATIGTTATAISYGHATFSNSADQLVNYCEYRIMVPSDVDTSVDPRAMLNFQLTGADTGTQRYVLSTVSQATSSSATGTVATAINLDFGGDGSGASGDFEQVGYTTLTGWGATMTANRLWVIRIARDGDAAQDTSTVNSTELGLVIEYGITQ